jgi:hypothetical protein
LRELELSLERKQREKEELRKLQASIANKEVLIKKEKARLKEQEIETFRTEVEVDRKIQ